MRRLPKLLESRRPAFIGLVAATVALAVVAALLVPADTALLSLTGAESAAALDLMADEIVGEALPSPLTRGRSAAAHAIVDAHKAVSVGPPRASDPSGEGSAGGGVEARLSLRSYQSQTDWHVNDTPMLGGDGFLAGPDGSGYGPGIQSHPYDGSNYVYMMDRHWDPWPVNYAIWSMGNRSGPQEINVYLPRAPRHALLLAYEVYTASGTSSRQRQVRPDEEAGWFDLGRFFGDGSEMTVVLDDTRAGYIGLAPREAVVDIDAVRIRCVAVCGTTRTPPLPVSELVVRSRLGPRPSPRECGPRSRAICPYHSGSYARWPAASGANLYEVEARRAGQADNSYRFYAHCCVYEFHRFGSLDGPVDAIRVRHIEAIDFISREEALERGHLVGSALHVWVGSIGAGPWSDWVEIPEGVPLDGGVPDGTPATSEDDPDRVPPGETPLTSVDPSPEGTPAVPTEETEEPSVVVTEATPTLSVLGRVSGLFYDSGSERAVWRPVPGARSYLLAMWDGEQSQILNVECCSFIIYLSQNHVEQINVRASNNSVNDPVYGPWSGWVSLPDPSIATVQDIGDLILPEKPERPEHPGPRPRPPAPLVWHSTGDSFSAGHRIGDRWEETLLLEDKYKADKGGCERNKLESYGWKAAVNVKYRNVGRSRAYRNVGTPRAYRNVGTPRGWEFDRIDFTACSGATVEQLFNDWAPLNLEERVCRAKDLKGKLLDFIQRDPFAIFGLDCQWEEPDEKKIGKAQWDHKPDADVITLSYGGNDLGFADILRWCFWRDCAGKGVEDTLLNYIDHLLDPLDENQYYVVGGDRRKCARALPRVAVDLKNFIRSSGNASGLNSYFDCPLKINGSERGGLDDFYRYIVDERLTERGRLYVVGYPLLMAAPWRWPENCMRLNFWSGGFSDSEGYMIRALGKRLNEVIEEAVAIANSSYGEERIYFLDLARLYSTGELRLPSGSVKDYDRSADGHHDRCDEGKKWLRGIVVSEREASYHPNESGIDATARALADLVVDTHPYPYDVLEYPRELHIYKLRYAIYKTLFEQYLEDIAEYRRSYRELLELLETVIDEALSRNDTTTARELLPQWIDALTRLSSCAGGNSWRSVSCKFERANRILKMRIRIGIAAVEGNV